MPITFEGLDEINSMNDVHVTDGRKTYFYNETNKSSSWFLPPNEIEKLVRLNHFITYNHIFQIYK